MMFPLIPYVLHRFEVLVDRKNPNGELIPNFFTTTAAEQCVSLFECHSGTKNVSPLRQTLFFQMTSLGHSESSRIKRAFFCFGGWDKQLNCGWENKTSESLYSILPEMDARYSVLTCLSWLETNKRRQTPDGKSMRSIRVMYPIGRVNY